ncbi:MAG: 30S ribosomal protein S17 [Nanoarchaeota archaeon]|nr:30S ribosomal protein S17 [Nanoarchaeota archaeon]MBU1004864.1 30S ribosomal protein S17 [Nanoarchaeota archaeon]MBU1946324.1 30S ribosomal protein S17 [Nanoarchaeota archaeon]
MKETSKNIGIKVKSNSNSCNDPNCPFHGSLKCRGKIFTGTISSTKMQKTATVEFERQAVIPKYERYEKRRTKIKAHNPECLGAREGDIVRISECRPLSKTKNFVVIENLGREKGFKERMEALEEGKTRKKEKEEVQEEKDAGSQSKSN